MAGHGNLWTAPRRLLPDLDAVVSTPAMHARQLWQLMDPQYCLRFWSSIKKKAQDLRAALAARCGESQKKAGEWQQNYR